MADRWNELWPDRPKDAQDVSLWESWPAGGRRPSLDVLDRLARICECSIGDLLADVSDYRHLDSAAARQRALADLRLRVGVGDELLANARERPPSLPVAVEAREDVDPMNRRDFLGGAAAFATTGALSSPPAEHSIGADYEADMLHQALDATTVSGDRLTYLEHNAEALGLAAFQVSPNKLIETVSWSLSSVRNLIEQRQRTVYQVRLVRVASQLATIMGNLMFEQGRVAHAKRWFLTGRHAALDVGDSYLADLAHGKLAYPSTYLTDPHGVLAIVSPRLDSNYTATPMVAWLWGLAARAHGQLGDRDAFMRCIDLARQALSESAPATIRPGIFSFTPEKLLFYEANGYAALGDSTSAARAAQQALRLYDPTTRNDPALVQLDNATALVHSGDLDEACAIAATTVTNPPGPCSDYVLRSRVAQFNALLTDASHPSVRDWVEVQRNI